MHALFVDDEVEFLQLMEKRLSRRGMTIVTAPDGQSALDIVTEAMKQPETMFQVVVMDVRMPGMDGLEATSRISALEAAAGDAPRKTRVIILTTFDLDEYVMAAINAGASGFLLKDTEPETLLSSIRTVYQGNAIIAPSATKRLIEKMMEDGYTKHGLTATDGYADGSSTMPGARPVAYTDPELNLLTEREREVLVEIAHGLSNQEIADKLFISLPTAKTHVAHILAKINARDRVQAVVFAYDNGLV